MYYPQHNRPKLKYQKGGSLGGLKDKGYLAGAASGASAGMALGPLGAVGGAAIGLGAAYFNNVKREREEREAQRELMRETGNQYENLSDMQSKSIMSTFPSQGVRGVNSFRNGGMLGAGSMKSLSPDLSAFEGPTHNTGGIPLDIDADNMADAEVEGGETVSRGKVYSNAMTMPKILKDIIKSRTGINVGKGTYANGTKRIAKFQKGGKFQGKFGAATKSIMDERANTAYDIMFDAQETSKTGTPTYKYGGKLPKAFDGINLNDVNNRYNPNDPNAPAITNFGFLSDGKIDRNFDNYDSQGRYRKYRNAGEGITYNHTDFESTVGDDTGSVGDDTGTNRHALPTSESLKQSLLYSQEVLQDLQRKNGKLSNNNDNTKGTYVRAPNYSVPSRLIDYVNVPSDNRRGPSSTFTQVKQKLPTNRPKIGASNTPTTPATRTQMVTPSKNDLMKRGVPTTDKFKDSNALTPAININQREVAGPMANTMANRRTARKNGMTNSNMIDARNTISQGIDDAGGLGAIGRTVLPYAANFLRYKNDQRRLDKLDTNVRPTYVETPRFNYVDRSGAQREGVRTSASNAINNLRRTSAQGNPAAIGAITAAQIQGQNQIADAESRREDVARTSFSNRLLGANQVNAGISNQFEQINTGLRNQKLALEQQNQNALIDGVMGELQRGELMRMDGAKSLLTALQQGDTQVINRALRDNPGLVRALRLKGYNLG